MNKELRAKTTDELVELVIRLKGQLLQYRFKQAHGELEKPHLIKDTKRLLARIYTILTERKVDANLVTNKANDLVIKQSASISENAKKAQTNLQKQRSEKLTKSKKRREENKKKVEELKQQQVIVPKKPKKIKASTSKIKAKKINKSKVKAKKTTNKMSSRTRRKGA